MCFGLPFFSILCMLWCFFYWYHWDSVLPVYLFGFASLLSDAPLNFSLFRLFQFIWCQFPIPTSMFVLPFFFLIFFLFACSFSDFFFYCLFTNFYVQFYVFDPWNRLTIWNEASKVRMNGFVYLCLKRIYLFSFLLYFSIFREQSTTTDIQS